jgi:hypothetical protein
MLASWGLAQIGPLGSLCGANWWPCVTFHDFQPVHGTLQLSMASATPAWINRRIIGRILALVFDQRWGREGVQVRKLWVAIPSTAVRTIRLNEALGLRREGTLRHHFYPNVHAVICSMMLGEYRKLYQSEPSPGVWARTAA